MTELDIAKTTTTDLDGAGTEYSVSAETLDSATTDETFYDFPNASEYLGYYKTIPELKGAIDALAIWTVGKGLETDEQTNNLLENLTGWGEDSIQAILKNMIVQKKVFGDAFAQIVRNDNGTLINLIPMYAGDMRIVVDKKGIIKRYEQRQTTGKPIKFKPEEILHLCNNRVGNEIHGVSVVEVCKWVIDARHEALTDNRTVMHRNKVPVRIIEVDTDDTTKRNALITEYEDAIKNGEVLVIPKGTVEIKDTTIAIQDPIGWITYLENFFYQAVGVPRVIASSQEYSEASSKVGYMTFEPIYTAEQTELEADLWGQLALRVKFNRPPSLTGIMQESEQKNTGQTGFQQNEVAASPIKNE